MTSLTLHPDNFSATLENWRDDCWAVICLCAAWCDVCKQYRSDFDALAQRHPDKLFLWMDIEDLSELAEDYDVENFPTLLIQRGEAVSFFGTMQPDTGQLQRVLQAQERLSESELSKEIVSTTERRTWQKNCNLRARLRDAPTQD